MRQPLLWLLVPTVVGREEEYNRLKGRLQKCAGEDGILGVVQLYTLKDNKEMTIGEKRQKMYEKSEALYSWQIDDDDDIADDAIELILEAIKQEPDCITFQEKCLINGQYYRSNFSLQYEDWADNKDGYDFVRTPFYKCVIKTDIARQVPFEHIRYGEDHAWSRALKPHLQTEVHIPKELYIYKHNSKPEDFNERYGFINGQ